MPPANNNNDDETYDEESGEEEEEEVDDDDDATQVTGNTNNNQNTDEGGDGGDEDAAMKALLEEWGGTNTEDDDDDDDEPAEDDDDDDDDDEETAATVLEDCVLDHIVLAAPDLDQATQDFQSMTGMPVKECGSMKGIGIRRARIAFDTSSYLEIIAPDTKQPGPIGNLILQKGIHELTPFAFAIRYANTEQLKNEIKAFKYIPDHICMFGQPKPDGSEQSKWDMLHLYGHAMGGICPFFINWDNTEHPCKSLKAVGLLKKFSIRAPAEDPIHKLMAHVHVKDIIVAEGTPKLSFQFSSPEGTIKFASSKPVGFKFPGFDDEDDDGVPAAYDAAADDGPLLY